MTREQEIAARLEAATPGPWTTWEQGIDAGVVTVASLERMEAERRVAGGFAYPHMVCGGERHEGAMDPAHPDTILIAHAPADLAYLLARVAELEAERARVVEALRTEATTRNFLADAPGSDALRWAADLLAGVQQ